MATYNGTAAGNEYTGTSGADNVNGGGGDDTLAGGAGADVINGGTGYDTLAGDEGNDRLYGQGEDDILEGGAGDDILDGGADNDLLLGGDGTDRLYGGSGDDILDGGAGRDQYTTGAGFDTVRFGAGEIGPREIITDFDPTQDAIDLTALANVGSINDLVLTQVGDNVEITSAKFPNGSITVVGVTTAALVANNSIAVACFVRGTLIKTPRGEVPVEALTMGDEVTTLDGGVMPLKWIGRRSFSTRFIKSTSRVVPVMIRANAIADGVPHRDLRVSPEHAVYVDGVLVPAIHLVNGTTIVRDLRGETIEYFHLELEGQQVIFADGAPAETYVNHNSRKMFANWAEYVELYGEDEALVDENGEFIRAYACVTDGPKLDAIRKRLNRSTSRILGYAA